MARTQAEPNPGDRFASGTIEQNERTNDGTLRPQDLAKDHPFELRHEVTRLNKQLEDISVALKKGDFKDLVENYTDWKKRIISNFTAGIARGLGLSVGTVVVIALLTWIASIMANLGVPYVSDFFEYIGSLIQEGRGGGS
ncbi:DUF5665 domain-containing protein [Saccharibacillus sp. CPCC 101409]|uniref:DUF5665 domain-containing protein n=1 Tax=Saccharibacillus sp. CPCC 101409 TaxID=3058041 RepID=UPI002672B54B|nr:DUF5665 domain-containing protein [Saccharibacillus sp. CPCC 101409]MDO3412791.1 DUF5665 domain-containing protein [Saccharibacillus sp. CPCC 101409]